MNKGFICRSCQCRSQAPQESYFFSSKQCKLCSTKPTYPSMHGPVKAKRVGLIEVEDYRSPNKPSFL